MQYKLTKHCQYKLNQITQQAFTCSKSTMETPKQCMFKVNNHVVLVSLLLTLIIFHKFFHCFHCWLWTSKYRLGMLERITSCLRRKEKHILGILTLVWSNIIFFFFFFFFFCKKVKLRFNPNLLEEDYW